MTTSLELSDWIEMAKTYSLTVGDLKALRPGQRVKFLEMGDRLFEYVCDPTTNPEGKTFIPEKFFRKNQASYKHKYESFGEMEFHWMLEEEYSGDLDFDFDIEYTDNNWCTLQRGNMPVHISPIMMNKLGPFKGKTWRDFPDSTRLGYDQSPLIPWGKIKNLPPLYWKEEKSESI